MSLWRGIEAEGRAYPAINISVGISGFGEVEGGVQGIQGFLVKGVPTQTSQVGLMEKGDSLGKRKRGDSGIARFFGKTEERARSPEKIHSPEKSFEKEVVGEESPVDAEMEMDDDDMYMCSRCHKRIPIVEMEVHEDYHVALELSKGSPGRAPVKATSAVHMKPKVSKTDKKGPRKKGQQVEKGQRKLEFGV